MKVLVTGANGMLGQDLCPILEDLDYEVIETDINNLDIINELLTHKVMSNEKPDVVIHCAAYTNVDKAEEEFEQAKLINVVGTENVAKACAKNDAILVYVSTDYIFDGKKQVPYEVDDKPNPINNYGLTKFQGEEVVKKYCKDYYIARTSWLYGHHGKNFVETMIAHKNDEILKVVNDQIGCPTWTVELANGIIKMLEEFEYGTYHICGSGQTSWYEFAKEIFEYLDISVNLQPCKTEDYPRPAKRPQYSAMNNHKICRNWKQALHDYLDLRIEE